jgi:aerobic-type carbon monoxide dehydrogenase small subunit (CoxS/CutS family)
VPPTSTAPSRLLPLRVNGVEHPAVVEPRQTLLEVLRLSLGLTGTKEVCEMGNCGACTVLADDEAVYACLVLAVECDGVRIETVEGLADGAQLSAVQEAFVACDALQCGFCTPGQVVSMAALLRHTAEPDDAAIEEALTGNLCRCGAYRHILDAARAAVRPRPPGPAADGRRNGAR